MTVAALTTADIEKLEQLLNHSFGDHQLLLRAITHASAVPKGASYERLEFLGDGVLECITKYYLYRRFPKEDEGFMTEKKIALVAIMFRLVSPGLFVKTYLQKFNDTKT